MDKRAPITVKFEIPYFTVSGIQVRYLKIVEKSGYQALPWVRYITQNGDDYRYVPAHCVVDNAEHSSCPACGRRTKREMHLLRRYNCVLYFLLYGLLDHFSRWRFPFFSNPTCPVPGEVIPGVSVNGPISDWLEDGLKGVQIHARTTGFGDEGVKA